MKIKAIIYDFDGVICDSVDVKTKAFALLYEPYGEQIQRQVIQYHLDHGGISRHEKIRFYHNELLGIDISDDEVLEMGEQFAKLVKDKVIQSEYIPGAYEFIKSYAIEFPQFVCTGTPEEEILEIIDKRNIGHFFAGIYGAPKKKTEIISRILSAAGLLADEVVYFGDALTDYNAAKYFDMPFIGVSSETTIFPKEVKLIPSFKGLTLEELIK